MVRPMQKKVPLMLNAFMLKRLQKFMLNKKHCFKISVKFLGKFPLLQMLIGCFGNIFAETKLLSLKNSCAV